MLRLLRSAQRPEGVIARVGEHDVHWVEMGSGRPVVLLHGLGDSHRTWAAVAPILARSHRVLMPDLCGHGLSSRPDASYTLDWHSRVLAGWLEELGLDEIDLVGHSYGGGVAQWMLLDHAHRVRRLALVAAGGLGREVSLVLRLAALPHLIERLGQPFMAPGTFLALQALRTYTMRETMGLSWMNRRRGTARAFSRSLRDVVDLGGQRRGFFQHAHQIPRIPPVGLFWGEDDPVIPIAHGLEAARAIDGASLTRFAGCGHYPQWEAPDAFAEALEAFLERDITALPD